MDETNRRRSRAKRVIKFCGIRKRLLDSGNKRANSLTLKKQIETAREREVSEMESYIEKLRQHLSPRQVAVVSERVMREIEEIKLLTPKKRPRTRRRWPASSPSNWTAR